MKYFIMGHSSVHDLYWMQEAQNWTMNRDKATRFDSKLDCWNELDYAYAYKHETLAHISIQQEE